MAARRRALLVAPLAVFAAGVVGASPVDGEITGLQLSSDAPGELTITWDAASPAPTDYRLAWAPVGEDCLAQMPPPPTRSIPDLAAVMRCDSRLLPGQPTFDCMGFRRRVGASTLAHSGWLA